MQYHLEVKGHFDWSWGSWFAPLYLRHSEAGTSVLSGHLPDQAALYGVLLKIDRLGLTPLALETGNRPSDAEGEAKCL